MSEQDLRDSMREALWDEPPLNFDPDSFMERAEKLTKRRRALASVGVVTALLIATVATLPAILVANNRHGVDTATSSEAAPPSPTRELATMKWPPNDAARQNHVFADVQPHLLVVWQDYLSPALQQTGVSADSIGMWMPDFQGSSYARDSSVADVLRGGVSYSGPSGLSRLDVTIAGPGAWEPAPDVLCRKYYVSPNNCTSESQGDGSVVVVAEYTREAGGKQVPFDRSAFHYRQDGSVVMMKSSSGASGPVDKDDAIDHVPLSGDELTRLAVNRGITLTPN
ncbi:hypothetical protein [Umezawaea sp. Da 62-37]|uniref:hypothetical protein n=1 Tax=Umezawaea sp. Da 62-37 TaxID=3075927 RepID=UPI0028F6EA47|nr:hypothetical protein [Umezawaea sp. Da 62-37]WNV91216.1 hypothetical protein RM788_23955 [Umezawaea sp. Da 62-37]